MLAQYSVSFQDKDRLIKSVRFITQVYSAFYFMIWLVSPDVVFVLCDKYVIIASYSVHDAVFWSNRSTSGSYVSSQKHTH